MRYEHIDNKYYQLSLKSSIFQICASLIKFAQLLEQIMMKAQKRMKLAQTIFHLLRFWGTLTSRIAHEKTMSQVSLILVVLKVIDIHHYLKLSPDLYLFLPAYLD